MKVPEDFQGLCNLLLARNLLIRPQMCDLSCHFVSLSLNSFKYSEFLRVCHPPEGTPLRDGVSASEGSLSPLQEILTCTCVRCKCRRFAPQNDIG